MKHVDKIIKLCFLGMAFVTLQSSGCKKDDDGPVISSMIGTTGPGGGIVFYDQGYYAGGWRYLEVSYLDLAPAKWGSSGITIHANEFPVGEGDRNNQRLLDSCLIPGETIAAQVCANYQNNGKSDWYLPTTGDYQKMLENLLNQGKGNFSGNEKYWTSCEGCNDVTGVTYYFALDFEGTEQRDRIYPCRAVRRF
jgi:hypothetical protein